MIIVVIATLILLSIITFILLARFYPPLNRSLFGGEFEIPFDDIQFWVKKVPGRSYYRVDARYLKSPIEGSGGIYFTDKMNRGGLGIVFNPENGGIYGTGVVHIDYDDKGNSVDVYLSASCSREEDKKILSLPAEWRFYYLGEGNIEDQVFKPIFPEETKFTFLTGGSIVITDAPAYYITIHLPSNLKKLEKEELEKPSLVEIIKEETRVKEW
jgi:hypothetical protein